MVDDAASELQDDYRRAGFNNRLGVGDRPALIVVDMCRAYFDSESPLFLDRPDVVDACIRLVTAGRAQNFPIVWTRVEFQPGGTDGGIFRRKVPALQIFERGAGELGQWVDGLEPEPHDTVITKQYASAFFGTTLASTLAFLGIDTTLIAGVSTSGCVRATALDACQSGFVPVVVSDACGDRDAQIHAANLFDLDNKYADVETLDAVLDAF